MAPRARTTRRYAAHLVAACRTAPIQETLRSYLLNWSAEQRAAVEEVATDFWAAYHEVAAEVRPQAQVVGDRFHAQKHRNDAVNTTRRAVQRRMGAADREFVGARRNLFLRNEEDLYREEELDLLLMKVYSPPLDEVHTRKEEFRTIYNTAQDRATAAEQVDTWLATVAQSTVTALVKAGAFVARWRESILNYFAARTSSGMVEGLNNKIKLLKRMAFGSGNDSHFRLRVLMACEGRPLAH
ncbi:MAG: transposase [Chloroflexota bacterium]|nr:transposase [Chloroflexota bacterium]